VGRCTLPPADDDACGTIACGGLDTTCRAYQNLTANRCASLGACKPANEPAACAEYTDLPCDDAGPAQEDSGGPQPGEDAGTTASKSGGCRAARGAGSAGGGLLLLLPLALRRRRRSSR
jgi:hypothetical protein